MLHLSCGPWGKLEPHTEPPDPSPPAERVFGDRGAVLDAGGQLVRQFESARWVYAASPAGAVAIQMLDEATALAAGHRPCEVYDPSRLAAFVSALVSAHGLSSPPSCDWLDAQLHAERLDAAGGKPLHTCSWLDVPAGAFVEHDWGAWLVLGDSIHQWSHARYSKRALRPRRGTTQVLTPPLAFAALTAGYRPAVHPSASASTLPNTLPATGSPAGFPAQVGTEPNPARRSPAPPRLSASRRSGEIRVRFHTTGTPWWRDEDHSMLGVSYETIADALFGELGVQRFLRWGGSFRQMTSLMPRPVHAVVWQEGSLADVLVAGHLGDREVAALVPQDVVIPVLRTLDMAPGRARDMIPALFGAHPKVDLAPDAFEAGAVPQLADVPPATVVQPGWYPDPAGEDDLRWWDGAAWTVHIREHPSRALSHRTA